MEAEYEQNLECSQRATLCRAKRFKFFEVAVIVSEVGGAAHTIKLCRTCNNERRLKQDEEEVRAGKWRPMIQ